MSRRDLFSSTSAASLGRVVLSRPAPGEIRRGSSILSLQAGGAEPGQFYTVEQDGKTYMDVPCRAGPGGTVELVISEGKPIKRGRRGLK